LSSCTFFFGHCIICSLVPLSLVNDVDSESIAFVLKPKSERGYILKTLRVTVIKKIDIIKQKNMVSKNGGNSSEPHSKR
jgi:hypothetical protein